MLNSQQASSSPTWIEFRTGKHHAKMPFFIDACECAWDKVLELTALGFRADRVGDAIVITGKPSNSTGVMS